jgi:predicted ATP-dependent endonuclease of OLD family
LESILIRNVGPIKECSFEVRPINIFIGPQASGKSTIAKLVYSFKSVPNLLVQSFLEALLISEQKPLHIIFKEIFRRNMLIPAHYFEEKSEVVYTFSNDFSIRLFYKGGKTELEFSEKLEKKLTEIYNILSSQKEETENSSSIEDLIRLRLSIYEVENLFKEILKDELSIFIPAGRLIYSNLNILTPSISKDENSEPTFDYFRTKVIKRLLRRKSSTKTTLDKVLREILQADVNLSIVRKPTGIGRRVIVKLILEQDKKIPLNSASSGQQEVLWILLIVQFLLREKRRSFLIIEEPEAHLFPATQKKVINLLALLHNKAKSGLIITTHSPYTLTSFNNLLYAFKVGTNEKKKEKVSKVIDTQLWINPHDVNAFFVGNGTIENIFDEELQLIKAEVIDQISEEIHREFNEILKVEFEEEE